MSQVSTYPDNSVAVTYVKLWPDLIIVVVISSILDLITETSMIFYKICIISSKGLCEMVPDLEREGMGCGCVSKS